MLKNDIDFLWKIGGEAGFGIMTTGLTFSKIAARSGYCIFDYVEYPSLIRGGHNAYEVRVATENVHSLKKEIDFLTCLNKDAFELHKNRLTKESCIIFDDTDFEVEGDFVKICVPFAKILQEMQAPVVMKNMIALGASLAVMGGDLEILHGLIKEQFGDKGEKVVESNTDFARKGYDFVTKNYSERIRPLLKKKKTEDKLVMNGNDAFSLGSVIGDCRLYAAYPMTPASSVLTTLASWQNKTGMVVRHPEDEIAAILTAIGASFAGVRAACGTSGGGFALKVESISFAGVSETPLVIFLAQRAGPATGMPTWTEQADLLFAVHAGHGEFPKIVLAPGDSEEMVNLTAKAFNLADIYQLPVIVLSDMLLSESHQSIIKKDIDDFTAAYKVNRGKTATVPSNKKYLRYQLSDDGISERLIPGAKGYSYLANSYEHNEEGWATELALDRINQVGKRKRKWETYLEKDFVLPKIYGDIDRVKTVLVGWGSAKGAMLEAQKLLTKKGKETAVVHFTHIYPLEREAVRNILSKNKKYVLVENNSRAQFGQLLAMETGIEIKDRITKYDGRPFWPEEIVENLITRN